jgi:pilus assembly protein Flp/PilA
MENFMYDKLLKLWINFRHNDEGVTLVEYGVAVAVAVGVGAFAVTNLVPDITGAMTAAGNEMPAP